MLIIFISLLINNMSLLINNTSLLINNISLLINNTSKLINNISLLINNISLLINNTNLLILRGQKDRLDYEVRKFRRRRLVKYHDLEQDLLREVGELGKKSEISFMRCRPVEL